LEIRIGVTQSVKEVALEMAADTDPDDIKSQVETALADESSTLWLTDKKGRQVGVLGAKIAYIEIGAPEDAPRVGFGS